MNEDIINKEKENQILKKTIKELEKKLNEYFNLYKELETKNEELIMENNDFINCNNLDNSNINNKITMLNSSNTQLK